MASKSKSYRNNPALQFISTAMVEEAREEPIAPAQPAPAAPVKEAAPATPRPEPVAAQPAPAQPAPAVSAAPAEAAAPTPAPQATVPPAAFQAATAAKAPAGFEVPMKPVYVEVRSKRFNALMQPSLYRNLSVLAGQDGVSVNELVHQALEQYVRARLG